jgi:hypothetical protein
VHLVGENDFPAHPEPTPRHLPMISTRAAAEEKIPRGESSRPV